MKSVDKYLTEIKTGFRMNVRLILDGEITIVSLSGRIEIEKTHEFRQACLTNFADKKVVFCMRNISFVGSSGIQNFFGVLNKLNQDKKIQAKIAGLSPDFQRLFQFAECGSLELHTDIEGAMQSF